MKNSLLPVAASMLFALVAPCFANEAKFDTLENAQKAAAASGKAVFLICFAVVPGDKTNANMQFTAAIKEDKAIAELAANFELAMVNCFSLAHARTNQCVNPALADKFGWPCTASVYGPGATRHLWRKSMSRDDTKRRAEHGKSEISATLKEALAAWREIRAGIDAVEAKFKEDKNLRADPDTLSQVAEAWAKAHSASNARKWFDEAIKAARKADKNDPRIETLTLRAAKVELECEAWAAAAKAFADFHRTFKNSEHAQSARVSEAIAVGKSSDADKGKARTMLQAILKDKKAASVAEEARAALRELESPPEK